MPGQMAWRARSVPQTARGLSAPPDNKSTDQFLEELWLNERLAAGRSGLAGAAHGIDGRDIGQPCG